VVLPTPRGPWSTVTERRLSELLSAVSIAASESSRPKKCMGTRIGILETANVLPGKATAAGSSRLCMNSRKRMRAAPSGTAEKLAAADVVGERRQFARLHRREEREARLFRRPPQRSVAFQGRIGCLEIVVRHYAEYMVGGIGTPFHPGIDIVAALDLPFVSAMRGRALPAPWRSRTPIRDRCWCS
jgi:hypothetical protein